MRPPMRTRTRISRRSWRSGQVCRCATRNSVSAPCSVSNRWTTTRSSSFALTPWEERHFVRNTRASSQHDGSSHLNDLPSAVKRLIVGNLQRPPQGDDQGLLDCLPIWRPQYRNQTDFLGDRIAIRAHGVYPLDFKSRDGATVTGLENRSGKP